MIDIGMLGLDTSHPRTFAETLSSMPSATVSGVWDGGDVRDESHVEAFCEEFGATRYGEPEDLLGEVDAVMVLTVNWDAHADLAVPFLDAGVPTFVDKPIAGRLEDVNAIADAASDAPLVGGSAVPFQPAFDDLPDEWAGRTIHATGFNHPFYYGTHLVDVVRDLAGADWSRVRPSDAPGETVTVSFEGGAYATLRFDAPSAETMYGVLDVTDSARTAQVDMSGTGKPEMYRRFVDAFLEAADGNRDDGERLLDGASLLLACRLALEEEVAVTPSSDELESVHVDGEAFTREYR